MDVRLHFRAEGAGEALILLHGNGEDLHYFERQIAFFSSKYHTIALDTRGHGRSPRGVAPFTIRQFAEDLRAFMDENDIPRAHLLGFSDGGNIALRFALDHPERVNRLILNGANLFPAGVKRSTQLPIEIAYRAATRFAARSPKARRNAERLGLMVNEPDVSPDALKDLHIPTLVIAGTRDVIRAQHTRLIAASLPDARLVLLPGGHFIAAKAPDAFNAAVARFLET